MRKGNRKTFIAFGKGLALMESTFEHKSIVQYCAERLPGQKRITYLLLQFKARMAKKYRRSKDIKLIKAPSKTIYQTTRGPLITTKKGGLVLMVDDLQDKRLRKFRLMDKRHPLIKKFVSDL